jgi:hypothetical protein
LGSFSGMFLLCAAVTFAMLVATLALSPPTPGAAAKTDAP